ncbi:MAG: hypothetical protein J9259_08725 [Thermoplasmata archaeon YP2-bin.285]|uniref:Uncharacterized protein n=1 Tax=Candidatus Sysuiplasma superficiale TaxID=2823368 RepID=A0A8J8CBL9_9ARCH|nr:hypothetical protein [Candidatus Sysuiplasma superficiale]
MADPKSIYAGLDDDERFGLSFGLFPARLGRENMNNAEAAELIRMSQKESGVQF